MDDIAGFVREALPMCSTPATLQPVIDVLKDIGVETLDDMQLVQIGDLAGVLKPIQARKFIAHVKSKSRLILKYDLNIPVVSFLVTL